MPKSHKYQVSKDDDVLVGIVKRICELYNISYHHALAEYTWYNRETMKNQSGDIFEFSHFILSLFEDEWTLKAVIRNKITEYATRLGKSRYDVLIKNESVQIGEKLYSLKSFEEIPADKKFNYLPMYSIEKEAIQGEAKEITKLMKDWGYTYDFIVSLVAYALRNENSLKIAFIIYGPMPNTGKSLFQQLLHNILEDKNVYATQLNQILNPQQRFKLANLHNKLLVRASELDEENTFGTSVFKSLCGGNDTLEGEIKGQQKQFNVRFQGLLVISTNHMPNFNGVDEALLSRLNILDFVRQFDPSTNVLSTIDIKEYQYVLYDAIQKVKEWDKNKKVSIPYVMDAAERIKQSASRVDPYHKFIDTYYEPDPTSTLFISNIRDHYIDISQEWGIDLPKIYNQDQLKRHLSNKLINTIKKIIPGAKKGERSTIPGASKSYPIYGIKEKKGHTDTSDTQNLFLTLSKIFREKELSVLSVHEVKKSLDIDVSLADIQKCLDELSKKGDIYEPKPGLYARVEVSQ